MDPDFGTVFGFSLFVLLVVCSLCSHGSPGSYYVDQVGLQCTETFVSASLVVRSLEGGKEWAVMGGCQGRAFLTEEKSKQLTVWRAVLSSWPREERIARYVNVYRDRSESHRWLCTAPWKTAKWGHKQTRGDMILAVSLVKHGQGLHGGPPDPGFPFLVSATHRWTASQKYSMDSSPNKRCVSFTLPVVQSNM